MKKRLLFGSIGLLVALVVALLVVPGLINWNDYKAEITKEVEKATGRQLVIAGDIKVQVLPRPQLFVHDVALSNLQGAADGEMVSLKSLAVQVAVGPLLSGNVQVDTVRLIEPVISLEVLKDGRKNWEFTPLDQVPVQKDQAGATSDNDSVGGGDDLPVRLDDFTIVDGTFIYRDSVAGTVERIDRINARIAAASLVGPVQSVGSLTYQGLPVDYEVSLGKLIEGRTASINLKVSTQAGGAEALLNGTLIDLKNEPGFKGKVEVTGKHLASLLQKISGGAAQPGLLGQAFQVEGNIQAGAGGVSSDDMTVSLGSAKGAVKLAVDLRKNISADVAVAFAKIDLDQWLALPAIPAKVTGAPSTFNTQAGATPAGQGTNKSNQPKTGPAGTGAAMIPGNMTGNLTLSVDGMTFKGDMIRDVRFSADIADGAVTLNQMTAALPGATDVGAFGLVTTDKGEPRFDGEVEANVGDLRAVARWLGAAVEGVSSDRLRKLNFKSRLIANTKQVQVANVDMRFDSSRLTGGITLALRDRPAFGADFSLDKINLDAYLPAQSRGKADKGAASGAANDNKSASPSDGGKQASDNPLDGIKALGDFDANMKLAVGQLTLQGENISNILFDGTLFNGDLDIRRAGLQAAGGAVVGLSGRLESVSGLPRMKGLSATLQAKDISGLARVAGLDLGVDPKAIGPVNLKARLDGAFLMPTVDLALAAAGGDFAVKGKADIFPAPKFDGSLKARHPDTKRLLSLLGGDYSPQGPLGAMNISATLKASDKLINANDLKIQIGKTNLTGGAAVNMAGARPDINLDVAGQSLVIDPFLAREEASRTSSRQGRGGQGGRAPAARTSSTTGAAGHWSKEPLDLSALKGFDGTFKAKINRVVYDFVEMTNFDLLATLKDGHLVAERMTADIYGGKFDLKADVNASDRPDVKINLGLTALDVARASHAMTGSEALTGKLATNWNLTTRGQSLHDMVNALNGNGDFGLVNINVLKLNDSPLLALPTALFGGLNDVGSALTGQRSGNVADMVASFTIKNGLARTNNLNIKSGLGNGKADGWIDLPNWALDFKGNIDLSENLIGILLTEKGKNNTMPFEVTGLIDAPNVKVDTGSMPGSGIRIPGGDKLLGKEGLGGLLQKVIPTPKSSTSGTAPTPSPSTTTTTTGDRPPPPRTSDSTTSSPPPPPNQQRQEVRPEDLIKGIFKKF